MKNRASNEQPIRRMNVVVMILPKPTNGVTILPNRNPEAPNIAEAVPAISLPSSIAMVVDEGSITPTLTSSRNVKISYGMNSGITM